MAKNGALEHVKQDDWLQPSGRLKVMISSWSGWTIEMRLHGATNCGQAQVARVG